MAKIENTHKATSNDTIGVCLYYFLVLDRFFSIVNDAIRSFTAQKFDPNVVIRRQPTMEMMKITQAKEKYVVVAKEASNSMISSNFNKSPITLTIQPPLTLVNVAYHRYQSILLTLSTTPQYCY